MASNMKTASKGVTKSSSSSRSSNKITGSLSNVSEDLTKYQNDYQAEINRRMAANPNDPTISQLNDLRNQKIASKNDNSIPEWLNTTPSLSGVDWNTGSANDYYEKQLAQQRKAIEAQTNSAIDANNAYIPQINSESDRQLQDAYIAATQSRFNAPQALAASGINGGAAESTLMGLETNYQNNRNNIEKSRTNALSDVYQNAAKIRATGDTSMANAASQYYATMAQQQADSQAQARSDFLNSIGAYANDYQAQINNVTNDGDTSNDWQIGYLQAARNQKLANQATSKADADQQAFENYLKQTQLQYNINKPYFKPGTSNSSASLSYSEALKRYNSGDRSQAVLDVLFD